MTYKYEPGKEYVTLNGLRARIYSDDGRGKFKLHGAIHTEYGGSGAINGWHPMQWDENGKAYECGDRDSLRPLNSGPSGTPRKFVTGRFWFHTELTRKKEIKAAIYGGLAPAVGGPRDAGEKPNELIVEIFSITAE